MIHDKLVYNTFHSPSKYFTLDKCFQAYLQQQHFTSNIGTASLILEHSSIYLVISYLYKSIHFHALFSVQSCFFARFCLMVPVKASFLRGDKYCWRSLFSSDFCCSSFFKKDLPLLLCFTDPSCPLSLPSFLKTNFARLLRFSSFQINLRYLKRFPHN